MNKKKKKKRLVIIEVWRGVAEVKRCPSDVDVVIIDHDVQEEDNED